MKTPYWKTAPIEVRFWGRLNTMPNGCLEWTGSFGRKGYGKMLFNSKSTGTHRVAWELMNGPIPDGLCVLHTCDNPPCCNVDHLFLGTNADNAADRSAKGRSHAQSVTHCPRNHPYSEANTSVSSKGKRTCRTCSIVRERLRWQRTLASRKALAS